jgi:hypothetical protein
MAIKSLGEGNLAALLAQGGRSLKSNMGDFADLAELSFF